MTFNKECFVALMPTVVLMLLFLIVHYEINTPVKMKQVETLTCDWVTSSKRPVTTNPTPTWWYLSPLRRLTLNMWVISLPAAVDSDGQERTRNTRDVSLC